MASLWPRRGRDDGFEREGDREYMAPEVLQGRYGKAADIFRCVGSLTVKPLASHARLQLRNDYARDGCQHSSTGYVSILGILNRAN
jgi:hypothetical protein